MKPTPCANPACPNVLTTHQVNVGGRFCSRRCAGIVSQPERPDSVAAFARKMGVTIKTARRALQEGRTDTTTVRLHRYRNTHRSGLKTVTAQAKRLGVSRQTLHKAIKQGRYQNGRITPAKRGRPRR